MRSHKVSPLREPETVDGAPVAALEAVGAKLGRQLYPWQLNAARHGMAPGRRRIIISTPRRSGKTVLVTAVLTHRCISESGSLCWYTAQTQTAAAAWFRKQYSSQLAAVGDFAGAYTLRKSAGSESVEWRNGSSVSVFGPTGDKVHGNDVDLAVVDEAFILSGEQGAQLTGAVEPAGLRRYGFALWIVSTVAAKPQGWLYDLMHDAAQDVLWYGCPTDVDIYDESLWDQWHPGFEDPDPVFQKHLRTELANQAHKMPEPEFRRAYGNQWPTVTAAGRISPTAWDAVLGSVGDRPPAGLVVSYDAAWDRSSATVAAAWVSGGRVRLEIVANQPGVSWLVEYLTDVAARIDVTLATDSSSPASDVTEALERSGHTVRALSTPEYAAACGRFATMVKDRELLAQPDPMLDVAVLGASRRSVADRWVWDRRTELDVSTLTAGTVAAFEAWQGARTLSEPMIW